MPLRGPGSRGTPAVRAVLAALRPMSARLAVWPAVRAVIVIGAITMFGVVSKAWTPVGLMYFGAACATAFVPAGVYRARLLAVAAQGAGAVAGFALGGLCAGVVAGQVVVAATAAFAAGLLGAVGRLLTGGAVMLVIGIGYRQFAGLTLPWWQLSGWYLAGSALVCAAAVAPWLIRRDHYQRAVIADVFSSGAALLACSGGEVDRGRAARATLALASAAARAAMRDHRLRSTASPRQVTRDRDRDYAAAESFALAAAALHANRTPVPPALVTYARSVAADVRAGRPVPPPGPGIDGPAGLVQALGMPGMPQSSPTFRPWWDRIAAGLHAATGRPAVVTGLRLAWCMLIATAVTALWHQQSHSYWIPLTVAVAVRPEYASLFVRTVNRVAGTVAGAVVAVLLLFLLPPGAPMAVAAAVSIGAAVLTAPRLYAFSVIGLTCSTLLSGNIGTVDPTIPAVRLLDTLTGAGIALVFGFALWPGRRQLPESVDLNAAARAARRYLAQAALPPTDRQHWPAVRDSAYRLAHAARAAAFSALTEPPPAGSAAAAALPAAVELEDTIDEITALAAAAAINDSGLDAEVTRLQQQIAALSTAGHTYGLGPAE